MADNRSVPIYLEFKRVQASTIETWTDPNRRISMLTTILSHPGARNGTRPARLLVHLRALGAVVRLIGIFGILGIVRCGGTRGAGTTSRPRRSAAVDHHHRCA